MSWPWSEKSNQSPPILQVCNLHVGQKYFHVICFKKKFIENSIFFWWTKPLHHVFCVACELLHRGNCFLKSTLLCNIISRLIYDCVFFFLESRLGSSLRLHKHEVCCLTDFWCSYFLCRNWSFNLPWYHWPYYPDTNGVFLLGKSLFAPNIVAGMSFLGSGASLL